MERATSEPTAVAVWSPSDPVLGAAVAANVAAVPGGPAVLVDCDADWFDAAAILLDDDPPRADDPTRLLEVAATSDGVRVVAAPPDPSIVPALRDAGGGVVALPSVLTAAAIAAECDVLVLVVVRTFPSLRRARMALDALPASTGRVLVVLAEGPPSDVAVGDVVDVLGSPVAVALPDGGRELGACVEHGRVATPRPRGTWGAALVELAATVFPDSRRPRRRHGLERVLELVR